MTHHSVIARHDSAEAISVGQRIATHLSGARNDKNNTWTRETPVGKFS
jgi:hypothetical protein